VADDGMSVRERRSYLRQMQPRYQRGTKRQKRDLLDEMEQVTGMHRKSLTRLLNSGDLRPKRTQRRPRRRVYGADVEHVVGLVWESLDGVCAERLTPALPTTAEHLERFGELVLTDEVRRQLETISISTVQRILQRRPQVRPQLPRAATERANAMRASVPTERIDWRTTCPGHFEVDLVHHSGPSAAGEYGHSLQLIDVATGWSERVMVLGRSQRAMEAGFTQVLARLPFPIRELHPDNGSEFFNAHLLRFFGEAISGIRLSRSRPYHKNDNRYVEQKNATLVRQYLGFARFDSPEQITQANRLYDDLWTYYNLFQPVLHLAEKTYVDGKLRRTWDKAQTPYQRLLASGVLDAEQAATLQQRYLATNPRALRRQIYQQLDQLWRTVSSPASEDTVSVA
jgi:hypothetical protein